MCAALGQEDEVKKEAAQKDEFNLPWQKKKDKDKVGFLYILTKMHRGVPGVVLYLYLWFQM